MSNRDHYAGHILGVDFSGSARAGEKIWVCPALSEGPDLRVTSLVRGLDLPSGGAERELVYPALISFIAAHRPAFCGVDFPLSLAGECLGTVKWHSWVETTFPALLLPEELKSSFPDTKRHTDVEARAPFSPLNLRMYRQTFYGLKNLVLPLMRQHDAAVIPMEEPKKEGLNLLEVCPASWLKKRSLYLSYKGKSTAQQCNRVLIWERLQSAHGVQASRAVRDAALEDSEGDALDAVIAAVIVHQALQLPQELSARGPQDLQEGRIFF